MEILAGILLIAFITIALFALSYFWFLKPAVTNAAQAILGAKNEGDSPKS